MSEPLTSTQNGLLFEQSSAYLVETAGRLADALPPALAGVSQADQRPSTMLTMLQTAVILQIMDRSKGDAGADQFHAVASDLERVMEHMCEGLLMLQQQRDRNPEASAAADAISRDTSQIKTMLEVKDSAAYRASLAVLIEAAYQAALPFFGPVVSHEQARAAMADAMTIAAKT